MTGIASQCVVLSAAATLVTVTALVVSCVRVFERIECTPPESPVISCSHCAGGWVLTVCGGRWAFLRNNNPLLACCASHRLHVVSRWQRIWINLMLVMLAIHLAVTSTETQQCVVYDMSSCQSPIHTNQTKMDPQARDQMRDYYAARGNEPPPEQVCCGLDRFGLVTIYDGW